MSGGYQRQQSYERRQPRKYASGLSLRLIIAVGIILFSVVTYLSRSSENPVTGENQRVALSHQEEMQLGLDARSQMIQQHGGLYASQAARDMVSSTGNRLVNALDVDLAQKNIRIPYHFDFHLLADANSINAFALPGGQVFVTYGLYSKLETQGQLAGVLGHEIGHVIERHGAERMAGNELRQALASAVGVIGGDVNSAQMAQMVAQYIGMKYGRDDELESDGWAVKLTTMAGYNPRSMLAVMDILDAASGGGGPPEMLSTHPKPTNRKKYIEDLIREKFPNGLPPDLMD